MSAADAEVIRLGDVGSTNDEAMARLRAGAAEVWVTAARQLAGRGRRGRAWVSEPGNLYASYAFRPVLSPDAFGFLPLAAALALAEALPGEVDAALKWPNDVLVAGDKCAGILIETEIGGASQERRAVIGFGVNIAHHPEGGAATHLVRHAPAATAEGVFARLAETLAATLARLAEKDGTYYLRERWLARAIGIGGPVTVRYELENIEGQFLGLDPSGRLILGQDGGATRLIAAGDVFVRAERL